MELAAHVGHDTFEHVENPFEERPLHVTTLRTAHRALRSDGDMSDSDKTSGDGLRTVKT